MRALKQNPSTCDARGYAPLTPRCSMKASQEESAGLWWPRLTPMNLGLVPVDVLESVYVILHHVAPVVHAEPANICAVARCDSSSASSSGRRA